MKLEVANCDFKMKFLIRMIYNITLKKIEIMPKSTLSLSNVSEEIILEKIYVIRGQKVMLDRDLAEMYGINVRV
jgi:ORF6N domain